VLLRCHEQKGHDGHGIHSRGRVEGLYYSFGDIFKDDGLGDNLKYDTFVVRGGLSYKF
jgi:hypothetical protein